MRYLILMQALTLHTGKSVNIEHQTRLPLPEMDTLTLPNKLTKLPIDQLLKGKKFIDLFAGIGGVRIGFDKLGAECVFTSEIDKYAQKTYQHNFNNIDVARSFLGPNYSPSDKHEVVGDITKIHASKIPDHDILLAGFPCQAFSQAGHKKGFADTRGTMFYEIARILNVKKPEMFVLENVSHLKGHNKGTTYQTIRQRLHELGYTVIDDIINAVHFVPQNRKRFIMVGFRRHRKPSIPFTFDHLNRTEKHLQLRRILHDESPHAEKPEADYTLPTSSGGIQVNRKYTISDDLWEYLQKRKEIQREKGNGFGYNLVDPDLQPGYTLSARYYKDGSENLVPVHGDNPRKLTPRECARLMGFPDAFKIPVSDTQAYKQFGNSVAVPLFEAVAKLVAVFFFENAQVED